MRGRLFLGGALLVGVGHVPGAFADGGDVVASAPLSRAVTIYRAPWRNGGQMRLDALGGFAVITEIRDVALPAGTARIRLEGVADGIVPESAIVTGLAGGVIEKNRDDALLSPSALMKAAVGRQVTLTRTNPKTGKASATPARIISASDQGVIFATSEGTQALRCDGVAQGLRYLGLPGGLSAAPTLSVRTRSAVASHARVRLTYIAENFDWNANYVARLSADGSSLELGGWITLANGNGISLPDAETQIVAGGLNRAYVARYLNAAPQVIARCWPMQTTSDIPEKGGRPYELVHPWLGEPALAGYEDIVVTSRRMFAMAMAPIPVAAPAPPPPPPAPKAEQLGDLKLYRLPERTTIAARQMKQSRLIAQGRVAVAHYYRADVALAPWMQPRQPQPMTSMLRSKNDKAHGLGLPLPAGAVLVEQAQAGQVMMLGEPAIRDTAEGEKLELALGEASDITVSHQWAANASHTPHDEILNLTNASPDSAPVELRLSTYGGWHVAPLASGEKIDGVMTVKLTLAAGERRRISVRLVPD